MAGFSAPPYVSVQINEMIYKSMKFRDGAGQSAQLNIVIAISTSTKRPTLITINDVHGDLRTVTYRTALGHNELVSRHRGVFRLANRDSVDISRS